MPLGITAEPRVDFSEEEAAQARIASRTIAGFAQDEEVLRVTLTRGNGERAETTMPGRALHLLAHLLDQMARGHPVALIPLRAELTTHQAAALLRVSRPYLIKLLDAGKLPCRKVGSHRRILYEDLVAYLERERLARKKALDEMAAEAQRLGLYE